MDFDDGCVGWEEQFEEISVVWEGNSSTGQRRVLLVAVNCCILFLYGC
jgi:hypothetical protein